MRRILLFVVAGLATAAIAVPAALATSPHFINATASLNSDGTLTANFKEAGLGNNQLIDYTLSANGTASYVCVNGGNHNPSATNKETVNGPVSASGEFNSGKNGSVTASLTLSPPSAGSFSCPKGQKLELASVSYTGVTLTDTTNNVSASLGDFDSGCLLPDVSGAC